MKKALFVIMSILSFFTALFAAETETAFDFDAPTRCSRYSSFKFIAIPKAAPEGNAFDSSEYSMSAEFISPSKKRFSAGGYYDGSRFVSGFVPTEVGDWRVSYALTRDGKNLFPPKKHEFFCYEQSASNKGGIVSLSEIDPLYLSFENGKPFYPVAVNLCWGGKNPEEDYGKWLKKYSENGVNFVRLWLAPWSFSVNSKGLNAPDAKRADLLEKVIDMCAQQNIYVMLCLNAHGEFSENTNPVWADSFYNEANGGPCKKPGDFFTDKTARQKFKNYLSYIVARYGAKKNVAVWELFNEADLTDGWTVPGPEAVRKWHDEMAQYIKRTDPHKRPVTTSFSDPSLDDATWKLKSIDMTQTHVYGLPDTAYEIWKLSTERSAKYGKPHMIGEFGIDTTTAFAETNADPQGIHVHNALWSGTFAMNCAAPMSWWWDIYIDKNDLYHEYRPLSEFIKNINWPAEDLFELQNKSAYLDNPSDTDGGGVIIYPKAGLIKSLKEKFVLTPDGELSSRHMLSAYLYGYAYESKRTEPMIAMKNATPSEITIKLKKVTGENTLKVIINGAEASSFRLNAGDYKNKKSEDSVASAATTEEITIPVPQGDNEVLFANHGSGIIEFECLKFPGYLDPSLAPVFISGLQGKQTAYLWIKNRNYEWNLPQPKRVSDSYIDIDGMNQGRYIVEIFDSGSGNVMKRTDQINDTGSMRVVLPAFERDIAVRINPYK